MTLEEIKNDIVRVLDEAWNKLVGTVDVNAAREVVSETTATLTGHVQAATQHLFDHVLGNVELPDDAPGISASAEAALPVEPVVEQPVTSPAAEAAPVDELPAEAPPRV